MSVINKLFESGFETEIIVKTNAPRWIYDFTLKKRFSYFPLMLDIGVVQSNYYDIDIENTLKAFKDLLDNKEKIIKNELSFIKKENVSLIVGDISPLAFEIAERAEIPGIAISNFTWDWIYEPYTEKFSEYNDIIFEIRDLYGKADLLLRLPFYGDMSFFKRIKDVPLVARKSGMEKDLVRKILNFPGDRIVVLISFGGFTKGEIDFSRLNSFSDYYFIATEQTNIHSQSVKIIENRMLIENKLGFEDLLKSSDIIITKPGYGTVSECIANKVPMIYAERKNFKEYSVLVEGIRRYLNSVLIPNEDLMKCKFEKYLQEIKENTNIYPEPEINGNKIAANILQSY